MATLARGRVPLITCAFSLRAALAGTDRPVHLCVHGGDKRLASQVSSWERGKLRCFRGGGRAQLGKEVGRRKWGRAGESPELQAVRCYSWLGSREQLTPNDSHMPRGKPPKPRSLCILPEVTMKSGGQRADWKSAFPQESLESYSSYRHIVGVQIFLNELTAGVPKRLLGDFPSHRYAHILKYHFGALVSLLTTATTLVILIVLLIILFPVQRSYMILHQSTLNVTSLSISIPLHALHGWEQMAA